LQVAVDAVGADVMPAAVLAEDEQVLGPGSPPPHRFDRSADRRVSNRLNPALAALGREVEDDFLAADRDVLAPHRRHAVALVGFRILLAADAKEAQIEETHGAGEG